MSSSTCSSNIFARLGLLPSTNSSSRPCSHGCCTVQGQHGATAAYPYDATAAFVVERLVFHMDHGHPYAADLVMKEIMGNESFHHGNLIQSIVMVGTDLLLRSNGKDKNAALANQLADFPLMLEVFLAYAQSSESGKEKERNLWLITHKNAEINSNLDCMRNLVRFYDSRNSCSCLKQAKEQHKERMGRCCNPTCKSSYHRDAKLLLCSGCQLNKYCCKECQIADWPKHKKFCKQVQQDMKKLEGGTS